MTHHTFKVALGFIQPPLLQEEVPPLELRLIDGAGNEEQTLSINTADTADQFHNKFVPDAVIIAAMSHKICFGV